MLKELKTVLTEDDYRCCRLTVPENTTTTTIGTQDEGDKRRRLCLQSTVSVASWCHTEWNTATERSVTGVFSYAWRIATGTARPPTSVARSAGYCYVRCVAAIRKKILDILRCKRRIQIALRRPRQWW